MLFNSQLEWNDGCGLMANWLPIEAPFRDLSLIGCVNGYLTIALDKIAGHWCETTRVSCQEDDVQILRKWLLSFLDQYGKGAFQVDDITLPCSKSCKPSSDQPPERSDDGKSTFLKAHVNKHGQDQRQSAVKRNTYTDVQN